MDEIRAVRDMYPARSFEFGRARAVVREALIAEVGAEPADVGQRKGVASIWRARRPLLVVPVVAIAALVLVPIGGASLGSRAVSGISSLWSTPTDQPALDAAASDAQVVAGSAYYTNAHVNDAENTVDLYLANAPASVTRKLEALHPGTYVIHNNAAHPLSELLRLERSLPGQVDGIDIISVHPTSDGFLEVGVKNESDVGAVQSALDSLDGAGIVRVYGGVRPLDLAPAVVHITSSP